MCMKNLTMYQNYKYGEGYKVLYANGEDYSGPCFSLQGIWRMFHSPLTCDEYKIGEWYSATMRIIRGQEHLYPSGFHILKTKEDAETLRKVYSGGPECGMYVVKVSYTTAYGEGVDETGLPCILSKDMMLMERVC